MVESHEESQAPATGAPVAETQDAQPQPQHLDDWDHDSTLGDRGDYASSTITLASSISKYREENGRTYHAYKVLAVLMISISLSPMHLN
jgi:hypothetical protein